MRIAHHRGDLVPAPKCLRAMRRAMLPAAPKSTIRMYVISYPDIDPLMLSTLCRSRQPRWCEQRVPSVTSRYDAFVQRPAIRDVAQKSGRRRVVTSW